MSDRRIAAVRLYDRISCQGFNDHRRLWRGGVGDEHMRGHRCGEGDRKNQKEQLMGHGATARGGLHAQYYHISAASFDTYALADGAPDALGVAGLGHDGCATAIG
jgi:hypothetical protein